MPGRFSAAALRLLIAAAWFALSGAVANAQCPGDCDGNRAVAVNELIRAVNIALGRTSLSDCPAADVNRDGSVAITDLIAAVNAALDGCPEPDTPTATATSTATPSSTPTRTPVPNQPPVVGPMAVYRSFPGMAIEYTIAATDPEGGDVLCDAPELPDGASLDAASGLFLWTPGEEQVGAYEVDIECSDDRGNVAPAVLPIRITALDSCAVPSCAPSEGCEVDLPPIAQDCCVGEPTSRVPEPAAACPPGLVLYAGRNERGFGRMQNCDLLQVRPFGQGEANVRFHVEARCVSSDGGARVRARLETSDLVLFDSTTFVNLDQREDGFAQELALIYSLGNVSPTALEGREAQLTLSLVDPDGVTVVEESLRIGLTTSTLGDLPEPDREDIPAGEAGCVGCHRPLTMSGGRFGIEEAHPWAPLTCTECHGGNPAASTRAAAHVGAGGGPTYLEGLASDELDAVPADYLRFVNPGDLRVAPVTCGQPGCHPEHVANVPKSVMTTYAAHYTLPRYLAGVQDRDPIYGAVDMIDLDFDPATAPPGAIPELIALRGATTERSEIQGVLDEYLPKSCPTCHLETFGPNDSAGTYRSSGCSSCHMIYADNGLSFSSDPMIPKSFPPHPLTHQLTSAIPVEQCTHCHFQGGRIGLAFRGIREGGFAPDKTPPLAESLGKPLYGHDADYYFSDEDTINLVDETPPDLHFAAGMVCVDCHVGRDVHGDGNLYRSERDQVGIRCEDCHGTVREEIVEGEDGLFRNTAGYPLRQLRRDGFGSIRLAPAMRPNRELLVPQIRQRLADGTNPRMIEAMGIDERGFSHTDSLECYTCHTSWRQTCVGCHVTVDDTGSQRNRTTGEVTTGAIAARRDNYSLDFYALGVNERDKITPLCSSMSMFFSYVDEQGSTVMDDRVRTSGDGKLGFGWNPFFHHTVSKVPQNCDRCHAVGDAENPTNLGLLRETYGFGSGKIAIVDGAGTVYDPTAFLNEGGDLMADFPHPDTGPVPAHIRERAMAIVVTPQPR